MDEVLQRTKSAIAPALRAVREWLVKFFGRNQAQSLPPLVAPKDLPVPAPVAEPSPEAAPKLRLVEKSERPRKLSRKATQVRPDAETLSELLDGLEDSFQSMTIPEIKGNWLPKKDINALHKLGIYIPHPFGLEMVENPSLPAALPLPALASCLMIPSKHDKEDAIHPRFAFAIRSPKLPPNVEKIRGTPYQFGYCVQLHEKESDKSSAPRLFWMWSWIVVAPSGEIVVPHELRPVVHHIQHRRQTHGPKQSGTRSSTFVSRQWAMPTMFHAEKDKNQEDYEKVLVCTFRQLLLWWTSRESRWSVGVRRDGKRLCFSIAPEHTAAYFADREKTVGVGSKAKKIIHFVRSHRRANGQIVKEHVRGLREFDWRGFHCAVTAPKLNGRVLTNAPIAPVYGDDDFDETKFIETERMAEIFADAEDQMKEAA